jgi:hypothetical protein
MVILFQCLIIFSLFLLHKNEKKNIGLYYNLYNKEHGEKQPKGKLLVRK